MPLLTALTGKNGGLKDYCGTCGKIDETLWALECNRKESRLWTGKAFLQIPTWLLTSCGLR